MKRKKLIASLLALGAILIPLSLSSCNDNSSLSAETEKNPDSVQENDTVSKIDLDSYEEQIAYYMALSESLREELLILKEENYVDSCEKNLKIDELEATIAALQKTILSMSTPDSGGSSPSLDQIVSRTDYEYTQSENGITITRYTGNETAVVIPAEINGIPVKEIGDGAFKGCSLSSVTLPSGIEKIGWFAFEGCTKLQEVYIPSSVLSIGHSAFNSCPSSMKIICKADSYAASYAQSWGIGTAFD